MEDAVPASGNAHTREVFDVLGAPDGEKPRLVRHLIGKLQDNAYKVCTDKQEDFDRVESRIHHLEICNYSWQNNLRIVLEEIGAGKRLYLWHQPDGYNACGDCPNRVAELRQLMRAVASWAECKPDGDADVHQLLGQPTPEKRWLVACLCKHVAAQHQQFDTEPPLPIVACIGTR